ncbi:Na(+)-translocating NADH-quinone reductase subunit C [Allorhodopirellula solitaria]|uniref:Na(+)-translocating NADH-quinone reductase subunit C n=1 Tax=Allorhodopirellula solitaria TaxID=2527987 RepID=A0A5C5XQ37_9BACT|nr:Na(+)-translocating NADH-quinone reductase subunit C [Allorhodopirellula solitaria]TWT65014.1 Na(+)-translocating NADH-quinone reductase subunit C [Allorhodopirellula solitaria]
MPAKDSTSGTILIATILCVVCSLAVSAAAVALKPYQVENAKLDQKKNILDAAGIPKDELGKPASELTSKKIDSLYTWIEEKMVDLDTGQYNTEFDATTFSLEEQASNPKTSEPIVGDPYDNGEDRRPKTMKVFIVRHEGEGPIKQVVLPIYGKGLWGTLWGYLALKSDLETVQGITFYQHKETPGLGGEVDNPNWKSQWDGLKLYDDQGDPTAYVAKGPAPDDDPSAVDGLSGATITSRGVTALVQYWASEQGYGPFLETLKKQIEEEAAAAESPSSAGNATTKAGA